MCTHASRAIHALAAEEAADESILDCTRAAFG